MEIGMMWMDNDKKDSLEIKLERAAKYYKDKYGLAADTCFVNPSAMETKETVINGILVRTSRSILPNHFWIGCGD